MSHAGEVHGSVGKRCARLVSGFWVKGLGLSTKIAAILVLAGSRADWDTQFVSLIDASRSHFRRSTCGAVQAQAEHQLADLY
jgi:hypothetical protein